MFFLSWPLCADAPGRFRKKNRVVWVRRRSPVPVQVTDTEAGCAQISNCVTERWPSGSLVLTSPPLAPVLEFGRHVTRASIHLHPSYIQTFRFWQFVVTKCLKAAQFE